MTHEPQDLKSILTTLQELRHGELITDLTCELHDLVTAVTTTGGKGELLLSLKVAPFAKGDSQTLAIVDTIKVKMPKSDRGATILFAGANGDLSRHDPRQPLLDGLMKPPATVHPLRETLERETGTHE